MKTNALQKTEANNTRVILPVKFVPAPRFPRELYKGPGTGFLYLPEKDTPTKGYEDYEKYFLLKGINNETVGAITLDSGQKEAKHLFILPDFREKGYGSSTINAVEEYAKKSHWPFVRGNVLQHNHGMRKILTKAGWDSTFYPPLPGGLPFYSMTKEFPRGIMAREPSKARKWKPVSRAQNSPSDGPPQKTVAKMLDNAVASGKPIEVRLPTFPGADVSAKETIQPYEDEIDMTLRGLKIRLRNASLSNRAERRENFERQSKYKFKPKEIRKAMKCILRLHEDEIKKRKLIVFAGYTGEFSEILAKKGFKLIFTDPVFEYSYRPDLGEAYTSESHRIQLHKGAEAYVSFEGIPALMNQHGMLTFLKALAETRKGIVIVSHYDSPYNEPLMPQLTLLSETYGLGLEDLKTSNLLFTRLFASGQAKKKVIQDLQVVVEIGKIPPETKTYVPSQYALPESSQSDPVKDTSRKVSRKQIGEIASRLELTEKEVFRSIKRLECAWLNGDAFNRSDASQ